MQPLFPTDFILCGHGAVESECCVVGVRVSERKPVQRTGSAFDVVDLVLHDVRARFQPGKRGGLTFGG